MFAVKVVVVHRVRYMWLLRWLELRIERMSRDRRVVLKTQILSTCAHYSAGRKMTGVESKRHI
jgi:hypothetical protein